MIMEKRVITILKEQEYFGRDILSYFRAVFAMCKNF